MASTSSLLKSAAAARKKVQAYEDDIAAFNWNTSAKTADDYSEYSQHLRNRATSVSDPSNALTYQQKLVTARRSYTSHEIQRQTIDVLEGRGNLQSKRDTIGDFYEAAVANDDLDLAQSLRLQWDNVDRALQAEQEKGRALGATMASAQAKSIEDAIDFVTKEAGTPDAPATYQTLDANGQLMALPTLAALKQIYEDGGEESINQIAQAIAAVRPDGQPVNFWDIAATSIENVKTMYETAADIVGRDTSQGASYLKKANAALETETFDVAPGLSKLTYKDVQNAIDASRAGQQLYIPSQKNGLNTFEKTKISDFVYGRDAEGNYKIIEVRSQLADDFEKGKITITGADGHSRQVDASEAKDLLRRSGFTVIGASDGELQIGTTGETGIPGVAPGTSFSAVIGRDGNLRLKSVDDRILDLELTDYGTYNLKEVDKEKDVAFGGDVGLNQYGKASQKDTDAIRQLLGQNRTSDVLGQGKVIAEFDANSLPGARLALDLTAKSPFASADLQRRINQAAARIQPATPVAPRQTALQAPVAPVQNNKIMNLNQTPVTSGGRLNVGVATPQKTLNVAAPAPTPQVTVGGLPKSGSVLSSYTGDLKVGF